MPILTTSPIPRQSPTSVVARLQVAPDAFAVTLFKVANAAGLAKFYRQCEMGTALVRAAIFLKKPLWSLRPISDLLFPDLRIATFLPSP